MDTLLPGANQTVAAVLDRWPVAAQVFRRYRMACVGCVMARFESIAEAAAAYRLAAPELIEALQTVAREQDVHVR